MTSINNSSSRVGAYASKGFSGLASGVDTESLVKQLLANTQTKIDKQSGLKQQTIWKQDIYRDLITSFQGIQNRFLSFMTPKTNLLSSAFYQTKSVKSSSNAIKVTSAGDITGNLTIEKIESLAKATKEVSSITASGSIKFEINEENIADLTTENSISITLDGVTKSIKLNGAAVNKDGVFYAENTKEALIENLNKAVKQAFGSGVEFKTDGTVTLTDSSRHIILNGNDAAKQAMEFSNGTSNRLNLNTSLKNLNLKENLIGDSFSFSVNGKAFEFNSSATLSDVMRTINGSDAGVRMSYSSLTDKFSFESTMTGAGVEISFNQTEGNLLSSLFGIGSGSSVTSYKVNKTSIDASGIINLDDITEGSFKIKVNGAEYAISIPKKKDGEDAYTAEELQSEINKTLKTRFGEGSISLELENGIYSLQTKQGFETELIVDSTNSLAGNFGFENGKTNKVDENTSLAEIGLNDVYTINGQGISGSTKLGDLSVLGMEFSEGAWKLTNNIDSSTTDNNGAELLKSLFGTSNIILNSIGVSDTVREQNTAKGTNATLIIDGKTIERNSNVFTIDGYQISLQTTSDTAIELTAENNSDQILDGLVQFVNDYNSLIEKISTLTTQKQNYKQYAPLTDEQKSEMKDKEIDQWEVKAKEGLVYGDSLLNGILNQMRTALYQKPSGSEIALYDIGITTSSDYREGGKLIIDEEKLRSVINKDPSQIHKLFADATDGIGTKLSQIIDAAAKSSVSKPGSLVALAGVKNTTSETQNSLNRQLKGIEDGLTRLKLRYEMEKSRYWKQFNAMEKVINKSNAQSGWLSGMFQ